MTNANTTPDTGNTFTGPRRPVTRGEGVTPAEKYLKGLCERSFLTLWSYPGVYRDQGKKSGGHGKEICDLLVVFDRHIIVFSDKHVAFPDTGDLAIDWRRWYDRAVFAGARQVWGAERWLREFPSRVFLDRECTQPFPLRLPTPADATYHRVVVVHGVSDRARREVGGSGSLLLAPLLGDTVKMPFTLGDLDTQKGYVHVLDDTSLEAVMRECDTITDFVNYLTRKERFIRAGRLASAAGEEELLTHYLTELNADGEHDILMPSGATGIALDEGLYAEYLTSSQRRRKVEADRISYAWDRLIEIFNKNVLEGTLHESVDNVEYHEQGLRLLAREPRVRRRMLARTFIQLIERVGAEKGFSGARVLEASKPGDPFYVFVVVAAPEAMPYQDYRQSRRAYLLEYCRVVCLLWPGAQAVVGLATEPLGVARSSEDFIVYDRRGFTEEERRLAREAHEEMGILKKGNRWKTKEKEYPDRDGSPPITVLPSRGGAYPGTERNDKCPCGSGVKYKKCHGP